MCKVELKNIYDSLNIQIKYLASHIELMRVKIFYINIYIYIYMKGK